MKHNFLIILLSTLTIFILFIGFTSSKPRVKDEPPYTVESACSAYDISGQIELSQKIALFEGNEMDISNDLALVDTPTFVLGVASEERWIEVDLSEQKLKAWEGDRLFLETPISSGLPWWKTPEGEFRIWIKLRATRMEGGEGKYYYNLPNVPYVMFFENEKVPGWKGYGLHGTYWHNSFGTPRSHGCVNLPTDIAGQLYGWTTPTVPEGKWMVKATVTNPGTRIVIHE